MKIEHAVLTDTGRIRTNNEDAHGEFVPSDEGVLARKGVLFLVADGMGGHRGGEIASHLAIDTIRKAYYEPEIDDPGSALAAAFESANSQIMEEAVADSTLFGMGTTCTAMVVLGKRAYFAHVGDSRAYLLRGGQFTQITEDHSLVGEMVRSGIISDEDARTHPKRNVITRSLGVQDTASADTPRSPMDLQVGDKFLLCSDGLTSYLSDDDLKQALEEDELRNVCRALVDTANTRGGRDNITVQVIAVRET